jgi:hypothetical protein
VVGADEQRAIWWRERIVPWTRPHDRFAAVACRRYWKHNLKTMRRRATKHGGTWVDGIHFRYQGGQVRSLISYLGSGENRE